MEKDNKLIAKKDTNKKLRDWYVANFDVSKKDDRVRALYTTSLDIQNVVGSGLITVFCPELLPLVPAIQKATKDGRLWIYDKAKEVIDKKVGIDSKNDTTIGKGFLTNDELNAMEMVAQDYFSKYQQNEDTEVRGRAR